MKKILPILYFTICTMLFLTRTSFAYIDVSATGVIVQVVAGALIAAGAAVGIFWKRIKNAINKKKYQNIEKNIEKKASRRDVK